jgi:hypothetical protein
MTVMKLTNTNKSTDMLRVLVVCQLKCEGRFALVYAALELLSLI